MPDYTDLALTPDGDLILEDYNFSLVQDADYLKQQARNRIQSIKTDWHYDHIGADLEELLGQANSIETAQSGVDKITEALLKDGLFSEEDLYIRPVPLDYSSVLFFVFINSIYWNEPYLIIAEIDLQAGITIREAL